jgi:hypothetical protein
MTTTPVVSEVLQAGLIVHIRVTAENLSGWQPEDGGHRRRSGTLAVQVVEILKGRLDVQAGANVELQITERGSGGGLVLDYYGVWAHVSTAPGTELVGFCDGASTDLAEQLTDEHCLQLLEATTVLDDLHLALGLDVRRLTADQLIEAAGRLRVQGGALFARYVWVNVRNAVVASADRFAALMRIAEDPTTTTAAQEAYLTAAYEDATVTGTWPSELRARLARAMLRAALDPATPELRDPVLGTFVPNLIGAAAPEALSAPEVFGDRAELAERVRSAPEAEHLRDWLAGGA